MSDKHKTVSELDKPPLLPKAAIGKTVKIEDRLFEIEEAAAFWHLYKEKPYLILTVRELGLELNLQGTSNVS